MLRISATSRLAAVMLLISAVSVISSRMRLAGSTESRRASCRKGSRKGSPSELADRLIDTDSPGTAASRRPYWCSTLRITQRSMWPIRS
ncbi:hypothetical protein D3C87_1355820 [compost metagenome]